MAKSALHVCNKCGCKALTSERYCEKHRSEKYSYDRCRPSASARGYDSKWNKARKTFLAAHPFCKTCLEEQGIHTPAEVVDHIIPHKGDKKLFWDRKNWQPLCKCCHDRKTVREDGGFGRGRGY
jgi:5-methylcytosine-specific restriction protein A